MRKRFLRSLLTRRGQSTRSGRSKRQNRRTVTVTELLEPRALLSAVVAEGGFENPVQPNNNWEQANGTGGGSLVGSQWTITGGAGITRNFSAFQNGNIPAPEGVQHALIQEWELQPDRHGICCRWRLRTQSTDDGTAVRQLQQRSGSHS